MILPALAFVLLAPPKAEALGRKAPFDTRGLIDQPYDVVRSRLGERGVFPLLLPPRREDFGCSDGFCKKYPETLNCTSTGMSICLFAFVDPKSKRKYIVKRMGEGAPIVTDIYWVTNAEMDSYIEYADGLGLGVDYSKQPPKNEPPFR